VARILVVEDDQHVRQALVRALTLEGHTVDAEADGQAALDRLVDDPADLVLLDVMMPVLSGLEVCRRLRGRHDRTPILMLTARHETADRVAGLDAGADDYLVKPFELDELFARVRALLRRVTPDDQSVIEVGSLTIDVGARSVRRGDQDITLTKTEFELLALLARNQGQVLTREVIYDRIWGYAFDTTSNSLDVYIGYLRRKTEVGDQPRMIHTVRGVGFVLRSDRP
jgi:two-component system response regulator MprA